jgi:hypothetical protein
MKFAESPYNKSVLLGFLNGLELFKPPIFSLKTEYFSIFTRNESSLIMNCAKNESHRRRCRWLARKTKKKSNKAYETPGRRQRIPHISTEHGWNISDIYVMATQWLYCAFDEFSCLALADLAGKVTHGVWTATEGLAHIWSTLPNELISYIKVIQCCRNIPGGGGTRSDPELVPV